MTGSPWAAWRFANRAALAQLRPLLLDLTGQGQTQQLARAGQQRRWLDRFGGSELSAVMQPVRQCQQLWTQAAAALEQARAQQEAVLQDRANQEEQLQALEAAQLDNPQERLLLEQEQDRLCHGVRLQQGCQEVQGRLIEGAEGAPSVLEHLGACDQELSAMAGLDPALQPIRQSWIDAQSALEDLGRDFTRQDVENKDVLGTLADNSYYPVNIAYFDPNSVEAVPEYEITFHLQPNGVVAYYEVDYGDFAIDAKLTEVKPLSRPECS